jgi:hypothetical protein
MDNIRIVHPTLDGVTTAVVLFLFACLVVPDFIKNRTQYYVAFACVLGIILMHTLGIMIQSAKLDVVFGVFIGFFQFVAVLMLVMCAGGMTPKKLAGELGRAYEVIRRGEEEKEVIVPLTGDMPKPREKDEPPSRIDLE